MQVDLCKTLDALLDTILVIFALNLNLIESFCIKFDLTISLTLDFCIDCGVKLCISVCISIYFKVNPRFYLRLNLALESRLRVVLGLSESCCRDVLRLVLKWVEVVDNAGSLNQ